MIQLHVYRVQICTNQISSHCTQRSDLGSSQNQHIQSNGNPVKDRELISYSRIYIAKHDQISVKQHEAPVVLFGLILHYWFSKWKPLVRHIKAPLED